MPGCTDPTANNFNSEADPEANQDDGTCGYPAAQPLFFSEYAEGRDNNNKYLEIYNPTPVAVSLTPYAYASVSGEPDSAGEYEYWNKFDRGAVVPAEGVYVICNPNADEFIQVKCDEFHIYLSDGNDGYCLVRGTETDYTTLDCIGDFEGDPGDGWEV